MIFISATDTGVGKTFWSSNILKNLEKNYRLHELAYYKPVQAGSPTDLDYIQKHNPGISAYSSYQLEYPASPNYSAKLENIEISLEKIKQDFDEIKKKHKFVVVEGAGGLAVPLNNQDLVSDIPVLLDIPMVLVIRPDLGTINHTLLSIEHARVKNIKILGIIVARGIFDARTEDSISSILKFAKVTLFHVNKIRDLANF